MKKVFAVELSSGKVGSITTVGYIPKNVICRMPLEISPQFYDCLKKVNIYDEVFVDKVISTTVEIDQELVDLKNAKEEAEALQKAIMDFSNKRLKLLSSSDYTQMPDYPISEELRTSYANYRQQLRDLNQGLNTLEDYQNLAWPTLPE